MKRKAMNGTQLKNACESITKLLAALTSLSILSSLLFGLYQAENYYLEFGIPFTEIASTEDYIRVAISNLGQLFLILPLILAILSLFIKNIPINFRVCVCVSVYVAGLAIYSLFIQLTETSYSAESLRIHKYFVNYGDDPRGVKLGHNGVYKVTYSKSLIELSCLGFIANLGEFYFFWSIESESMVSINVNHLISVENILFSKPAWDKKKSPRWGTFEDFEASDFGQSTIDWERNKNKLCPKAQF